MIEEVRLRGLGIIDEATLALHPGLTVVTGETGAGKTMVLTGLGLLLGAKSDAGAVRRGADRAEVDGRWLVEEDSPAAARAREAGAELDDGALLVARTVTAEGRSRAFVGGRAVPAGVVAEVTDGLVAVHGQHDQVRLSSPARQRDLLDRFGGPSLLAAADAYRATWAELRAVETARAALADAARERAREADLLRFGVDEVAAVSPEPGEDAALGAESQRLSHAEALVAAAHRARTALAADAEDAGVPDVLGLIAGARRALDSVREHDAVLGTASDRLAEASSLLADVAADLASYESSVEADPRRQEVVEERRAAIAVLTRKYGDDVAAVLDWARDAAARLADLDGTDERLEALAGQVVALRDRLARDAVTLHEARVAAADRLSADVTAELVHLAMPHAQVVVRVSPTTGEPPQAWVALPREDGVAIDAVPGPHGIDEVEVLLAPHAGAEPRQVARSASGGELSRVMLALEVALAGADPVPTFVFDEVDAGIGGKAAVEVGRRLARLARGAQVVVVTHLPQVAAFADRHLVVAKTDDGRITRAGVVEVEGEARLRELARMLAGLEDSDSAAAHAAELLALAASDHASDHDSDDGGGDAEPSARARPRRKATR